MNTGVARNMWKYFRTIQVSETGKFGNRIQKGSGLARRLGQDVSRAPDSGIGNSQDYRSQWADDVGLSKTHATRRVHNGWDVNVRLGINSAPVHMEGKPVGYPTQTRIIWL